jgi:hypothetical protein
MSEWTWTKRMRIWMWVEVGMIGMMMARNGGVPKKSGNSSRRVYDVVKRLGFSGMVSLLNLQTRIVFTCKTLQTSHMPMRFHYTSVASEIYGFAPTEILLAMYAELNSYGRLKKMASYLTEVSVLTWCVRSGACSTLIAL